MKKRIFTGFLAVLVVIMSMISCFAQGVALEETHPITVKTPSYNQENNTLSFVVANTGEKSVLFQFTGLEFFDETINYGNIQKEPTPMTVGAGGEVKIVIPVVIPVFDAKNPPVINAAFQYLETSETSLDLSQAEEVKMVTCKDIFSNDVPHFRGLLSEDINLQKYTNRTHPANF